MLCSFYNPAGQTVRRVRIGDTVYEAKFLAKADRTGLNNFSYFEFWHLEDTYDDLKERDKTGDYLPYNNYPSKF